jgi:hypothetical protein
MGGLVTLEVKPTCSDNCTTTAKTEILQRVHPEGILEMKAEMSIHVSDSCRKFESGTASQVKG